MDQTEILNAILQKIYFYYDKLQQKGDCCDVQWTQEMLNYFSVNSAKSQALSEGN